MDASTIRTLTADRDLARLSAAVRDHSEIATIDLIGQYDRAIASYAGRFTNCSPRQKRIDYIVDLIDARADEGDDVALRWFEEAR